jgi:osmotically-inducible protein OsmY
MFSPSSSLSSAARAAVTATLVLGGLGAVSSLAPLEATETDDRILAAVRGSYNFKTYLAGDPIHVAAKRGAVTLTGEVLDELHRALAEETVAGLPGVSRVNNQLSLRSQPSSGTPDAGLRTKVQAALLFHRQFSALQTRVQVQRGVVTLQGEADSEANKRLCTTFVQGLDGVVRVENQLTVVPEHPEKPRRKAMRKRIDDASITGQVKLALLFNHATSATRTRVRTENGVVHLEGAAGSRAEKRLVSRVAWTVEGIRNVNNHMTVEE